MKTNKFTITGVRVNLTACDWQLYDKPGAEKIAKELNEAISNNVAKGRIVTRQAAEAVMNKYDGFGTMDSEPRWVLYDLLNTFFGKIAD